MLGQAREKTARRLSEPQGSCLSRDVCNVCDGPSWVGASDHTLAKGSKENCRMLGQVGVGIADGAELPVSAWTKSGRHRKAREAFLRSWRSLNISLWQSRWHTL